MTTKEKEDTIKFAVEVSNHRVPIIAGTGGNNTETAIEMSKYAESVRRKWTFSCNSIL